MCFIFAYVFICYFFTVIKNEKPYEKPKTKCMGTSTTNLSETAPLLKGGLLNKDVSKGNYSAFVCFFGFDLHFYGSAAERGKASCLWVVHPSIHSSVRSFFSSQ